MSWLLDVNVLVALGWADHQDHARVVAWMTRNKNFRPVAFLTSPIPQMGFVRVSVQRSGGQITPELAGQTLEAMLNGLGRSHQFIADDQPCFSWPAWCRGAARTTDAHLLALARAHGAELATLDAGIPSAFLVP